MYLVLSTTHLVRGVWGPILARHFALGGQQNENGAESEIWDRGMWNIEEQNAYFARKNFFHIFFDQNIYFSRFMGIFG